MRSAPPLPKVKQIENLKYRNKKEQAVVRISDLRAYVNEKNTVPEDINHPYVIGFDSAIVDEQERFCVTWTTPRLSQMQRASKMLQVDATYKITWLNYPVFVSLVVLCKLVLFALGWRLFGCKQ